MISLINGTLSLITCIDQTLGGREKEEWERRRWHLTPRQRRLSREPGVMVAASSNYNSGRQLSALSRLGEPPPSAALAPNCAAREFSAADNPAAHGESEPSTGVTVHRDSLGKAAAVASQYSCADGADVTSTFRAFAGDLQRCRLLVGGEHRLPCLKPQGGNGAKGYFARSHLLETLKASSWGENGSSVPSMLWLAREPNHVDACSAQNWLLQLLWLSLGWNGRKRGPASALQSLLRVLREAESNLYVQSFGRSAAGTTAQQFLAALPQASPIPPFPFSSFLLISSLLPLPLPRKPHFFCRDSLFLYHFSLLFYRSPPPLRVPFPRCPGLSPLTPLSPSYRLTYPLFFHPLLSSLPFQASKKRRRGERVGKRERWRWGDRRGRGEEKREMKTMTRERARARACE